MRGPTAVTSVPAARSALGTSDSRLPLPPAEETEESDETDEDDEPREYNLTVSPYVVLLDLPPAGGWRDDTGAAELLDQLGRRRPTGGDRRQPLSFRGVLATDR